MSGERPLDTLGKVEWVIVEAPPEGAESGAPQRVVFQTRINGVVIQKVYTLAEGEYHIGLEVRMFQAQPDGQTIVSG